MLSHFEALIAYQKAVWFLYQMVQNDQPMYRKSLENAIRGQENARKVLELPENIWKFAPMHWQDNNSTNMEL